MTGRRFHPHWSGPAPSITCPVCGRTSHHPEDVRQGYCGFCHRFTGTADVVEAMQFAREYAERSGVTVEWLHENGRDPYRCRCDEEMCEGWAMMSPENAADEVARGRAQDVCGWLT